MRTLEVRNVHQALPKAIDLLAANSVQTESSRAGSVLVAPWPVTTVYRRPCERVLFHAWRDANPFFHLYEALWMLAGRRDVAPLAKYVKRMIEFSDDGENVTAAYGHRWRSHFHDFDQLDEIVRRLRKYPDDRRSVLQIWDPVHDLAGEALTGTAPKDVACNISATFQIRDGRLCVVVFCRSNDILWGAYGADAVDFSMLLEYMAARVGVPVGTYTHVSVNWHAYEREWMRVLARAERQYAQIPELQGEALLWARVQLIDPYEGGCQPMPLVHDPCRFDDEIRRFVLDDGAGHHLDSVFREPFLREANKLARAHDMFLHGDRTESWKMARACRAEDWQIACTEWISRRRRR